MYALNIKYNIPKYCLMGGNNNGIFIFYSKDLDKIYKIKTIIYLDFLKNLSDSCFLCICEDKQICKYCKDEKDTRSFLSYLKPAKEERRRRRIKTYWDFDKKNDYLFKSQFITYGGQTGCGYELTINDIDSGKFSQLCDKVITYENIKPSIECEINTVEDKRDKENKVIYQPDLSTFWDGIEIEKEYECDYNIFLLYLEKHQLNNIIDLWSS